MDDVRLPFRSISNIRSPLRGIGRQGGACLGLAILLAGPLGAAGRPNILLVLTEGLVVTHTTFNLTGGFPATFLFPVIPGRWLKTAAFKPDAMD